MTRSLRQFPFSAERPVTKRFKTTLVFSGLIEEVKLFDKALTDSEVRAEYATLKPSGARPLKPWVLPAGPEASPGFRAEYTKLSYSPEWDGLWRGQLRGHRGDHCRQAVALRVLARHALPAVLGHRP
jgi:hypothetical protein